MSIEDISFQLILHGGDAKSHAMEAMQHARAGDFEKAETSLEASSKALSEAHKTQTGLIQGEARGESVEIRMLLIHGQDHLMNAITINDLAREIVEIHKRMAN